MKVTKLTSLLHFQKFRHHNFRPIWLRVTSEAFETKEFLQILDIKRLQELMLLQPFLNANFVLKTAKDA